MLKFIGPPRMAVAAASISTSNLTIRHQACSMLFANSQIVELRASEKCGADV